MTCVRWQRTGAGLAGVCPQVRFYRPRALQRCTGARDADTISKQRAATLCVLCELRIVICARRCGPGAST